MAKREENIALKLFGEIVEREKERKYRTQNLPDLRSWCDYNKGHFLGLKVISIIIEGTEIRLCTDCFQSIIEEWKGTENDQKE